MKIVHLFCMAFGTLALLSFPAQSMFAPNEFASEIKTFSQKMKKGSSEQKQLCKESAALIEKMGRYKNNVGVNEKK